MEDMAGDHNLFREPVMITARTLTSKEAIGEPERKNFPLLKGKEVMIEAQFLGQKGQAYTGMPGDYKGTIRQILAFSLCNDFERACLIASLNAVMRHLGLIEKTVHCRDHAPERCAANLPQYVRKRFGKPKIAFIGFQPAMIDCLSRVFELRVVDLDEDNIGKKKYDLVINGPDKTDEIVSWSNIIIATGSTSINGTIKRFLTDMPVIFYGVSIAGIAKKYHYERYCPCAY